MIQALLDYYKIPPEAMRDFLIHVDRPSGEAGFFQFNGPHICYGQCASGVSAQVAGTTTFDALKSVSRNGASVQFPFDFDRVIENLRLEKYRSNCQSGLEDFASSRAIRNSYYAIRDLLPFQIRRKLQQIYFRDWEKIAFPAWPVDLTVDSLHEELLKLWMEASGTGKLPFIWFWPEGAPSCLIITHDVETSAGRDSTFDLIALDASHGFKAAFQVIPERRYVVPDAYVNEIRDKGCEFNIHDLNHDGQLYAERSEFLRRAETINEYARRYHSQGFRAGAMYRRQDWYSAFKFEYDMSVPNVAHLEPLRGGCCTVMPYFMGDILELPLTTAQDYSLFHILNDYSIELWKQQISLIKKKHGLISILTHPDYLMESRARSTYKNLLAYLREMVSADNTWEALPGEVNRWWRARKQMRLVENGDSWRVEGPEKERARIAFVTLEGDRLNYVLP